MIDYRIGDGRDLIAQVPDGCVDLVACSPPFLALRSYLPADHEHKHAEIGSEPDPATFLDTLLGLTAEWGRVLAPHGSIVIELGDTFSGSSGENHLYEGSNKDGGFNGGWPRPKSLALIPQLYATSLAYGRNLLTGQESPAGQWLVRNVIVWHRPNPAVGALGDKFRPSTSYIVVATKSPKRWFDLTAVRTEHVNDRAQAKGAKNAAKARGDGQGAHGFTERTTNPAGAPPLDCWTDEYDHHDTWTLTTQPSRLSHYAMWPPKLAERLILSMCPAEVCTSCGEPRRRVEGKAEYVPSASYRGGSLVADAERVADGVNQWVGDEGARASLVRQAPTLGWTDCGCLCGECGDSLDATESDILGYCPHKFIPGTVLDPFAGTFTTGCVAEFHGRSAIGIDLDERNRDMWPLRREEVFKALNPTHVKPLAGQLDMFGGVA